MRGTQVTHFSVASQRMLCSMPGKAEKLVGRVGSPVLSYVLLGLE